THRCRPSSRPDCQLTATVVGDPYTSALDLTRTGFSAKLPDQFASLGDARGADRMASSQQTAARVDRDPATDEYVSRLDQLPASSRLGQPHVFVGEDFGRCSGVVRL